jgi:hypothetical protein
VSTEHQQQCRDCSKSFPYDPDADRCPACVTAALGDVPDEDERELHPAPDGPPPDEYRRNHDFDAADMHDREADAHGERRLDERSYHAHHRHQH